MVRILFPFAVLAFLTPAALAANSWMMQRNIQSDRNVRTVTAGFANAPETPPAPFGTQVVVRTVEQFADHKDVVKFMKMAAANGVSVVSIAAKQDEDDEVPSGEVFYRSAVAPIAKGYRKFDAFGDAVAEAHRHHLKIHAWVPQFHDQAAAKRHPDWQMRAVVDGRIVPFQGNKSTEFFVNPLNPLVQQYELSIIEEIVTRYEVDGVALDWIRFDDYNMDMSDETRQAYHAESGLDPATIDFEPDDPKVSAWNAWRERRLADYVRLVRKTIERVRPGMTLGLYALPPQFTEDGQDVALFAPYVDFISPLGYFADWGYDPGWVYRELAPSTIAKSDGKPVVPALDIWWKDTEYCEIISNLRARYPEIRQLAWFKYGRWKRKDLARTDRLRHDPCMQASPAPTRARFSGGGR